MATRNSQKRTIKLRQANAQGQEFIKVESKKGVQWASCNMGVQAPKFPNSFDVVGYRLLPSVLGLPIFIPFAFLSGVVDALTTLSTIPSIFITNHGTTFQEFKKPCDPHEGLF